MTVESPPLHPAAPANYRKGAAMTWHQRRRHRAVLGLLRQLSGSVLDYGCGYGDLAFAMSQTHVVVGVDADSGRIDFARQEYPSPGKNILL
jgi:2-polyprenyl-3-methyl-5-hydroxy-6-metoxy-1,4-benzoquinol methylase